MVHILGGNREVLLALGAINQWIERCSEPTCFHLLVDTEQAYSLVSESGLATTIDIVPEVVCKEANALALYASNHGGMDIVYELRPTESDCMQCGEVILDTRIREYKRMSPDQEVPEMHVEPAPYVLTCLMLLAEQLEQIGRSWNVVKNSERLDLPPYCRVLKKHTQTTKELRRRTILLEDGLPLKGSPYILVDYGDEETRRKISDVFYMGENKLRIYPVFVEGLSVNGTPVTVQEMVSMITAPTCEVVIGGSDSWLVYAAAGMRVNHLVIIEPDDLWRIPRVVRYSNILHKDKFDSTIISNIDKLVTQILELPLGALV